MPKPRDERTRRDREFGTVEDRVRSKRGKKVKKLPEGGNEKARKKGKTREQEIEEIFTGKAS